MVHNDPILKVSSRHKPDKSFRPLDGESPALVLGPSRPLQRSISSPSMHLARVWSRKRLGAPATVRHRPERASRSTLASLTQGTSPPSPPVSAPTSKPTLRVVTAPQQRQPPTIPEVNLSSSSGSRQSPQRNATLTPPTSANLTPDSPQRPRECHHVHFKLHGTSTPLTSASPPPSYTNSTAPPQAGCTAPNAPKGLEEHQQEQLAPSERPKILPTYSLKSNVKNPPRNVANPYVKQIQPFTEENKQSQLTPISEDDSEAKEALRQTVAFTEKLAATKVFFETQYSSSQYKDISPRSLRRRRMELSLYVNCRSNREAAAVRHQFWREESNHLRQERLAKARRLQDERGLAAAGYQPLRILGKGSFGLVRLVRDLSAPRTDVSYGHHVTPATAGQVYAMKVIRKEEMLKSCQESHLRAERDFLAEASGTSRWVMPLRASFQDHDNLYLVMDYAVGGDFLGLLLREEVITEACAQFYIAEMICCIEETHNMGWIHRDVKPDNFLISASGHLKISDFGLAFDGEYAHTQSYYSYRRYSLLEELGISVQGDELDRQQQSLHVDGAHPLGHPQYDFSRKRDPRFIRRLLANSVVGTSQYMAPEVVDSHGYDGRCD